MVNVSLKYISRKDNLCSNNIQRLTYGHSLHLHLSFDCPETRWGASKKWAASPPFAFVGFSAGLLASSVIEPESSSSMRGRLAKVVDRFNSH